MKRAVAELVFFVVLLLIAVAAGLIAHVSNLPGTFRYERRAMINAAPDKIFPLINDFHAWQTWSPWEKLDPGQKRTYSGAPAGPGAVYAWEGNNKVGEGRMEILETTPSNRVLVKLDFLKPFKAQNFTEFSLEPAGAATNVTWTMYGPNPFMSKVLGLMMNMEKMIGKDFEAGLANMKAAAEK